MPILVHDPTGSIQCMVFLRNEFLDITIEIGDMVTLQGKLFQNKKKEMCVQAYLLRKEQDPNVEPHHWLRCKRTMNKFITYHNKI